MGLNPRKRIHREVEPIINDILKEYKFRLKRRRFDFSDLTKELQPFWREYLKRLKNVKKK